jgi:hypothetical protein
MWYIRHLSTEINIWKFADIIFIIKLMLYRRVCHSKPLPNTIEYGVNEYYYLLLYHCQIVQNHFCAQIILLLYVVVAARYAIRFHRMSLSISILINPNFSYFVMICQNFWAKHKHDVSLARILRVLYEYQTMDGLTCYYNKDSDFKHIYFYFSLLTGYSPKGKRDVNTLRTIPTTKCITIRNVSNIFLPFF